MPVPTTIDRPDQTLLRDRVVEKVTAAILDGTLRPGERLHDDELIAWLGVSRTPIREALTHLVSMGLVETEANRWTRVAAPPETAIPDALHTLGVLFGGITRLAVASMTDEQIASSVARMDESIASLRTGDSTALAYDSPRIYDAWLALCPNVRLATLARHVYPGLAYTLRGASVATYVPADRAIVKLTALRDAVLRRDPIAAELAMERIHMLHRGI